MNHSIDSAQLDFLGIAEAAVPVRGRSRVEAISPPQRTALRPPPRLADTSFCEVTDEKESRALWVRLKAGAPVMFTPALLGELRTVQRAIAARVQSRAATSESPRFQVFASRLHGVFSLGGDLALFRACIARRDARALREYARDAVDLVYATATAYDAPLTTVSLVQGQALGGGFEAALASQVLIAERGARMGLPEVMFNMFPGMGAFQLLSRRVTPAQAERMILSGRTYSAEELHAMGVVDVLADDGDGENAVRRYIRTHERQHHGHAAFRRARQAAAPLDVEELYRMADVWVDTALDLAQRDLETIDYLLRAQQRAAAKASLHAADAGSLMEA